MERPLTETLPWRTSSAASRREQMPAWAMYLFSGRRSPPACGALTGAGVGLPGAEALPGWAMGLPGTGMGLPEAEALAAGTVDFPDGEGDRSALNFPGTGALPPGALNFPGTMGVPACAIG